ncbi:MAG TPA: hypothetical protein VFP96_15020 [Candidatus Acidoferrum sp.]|jgi:hypothetical protein|nr:hypothetical protein [Candidatus Acidoferrum sp.]
MARGWESKDVEAQVDAKTSDKPVDDKSQKSQDQLNNERERQGLELSKKRVLADLENATHPNHRKSLEAALAHLDAKIESLK